MNTQGTLIVYPNGTEQITVLRAFMQALNIRFEISNEGDNYNKEFVEKIKESRRQAKEGKVTRVKKENLKEFLAI